MSYSPEFDGPIAGWTVNFVSKNFWKVARTQEREDVMQEAYMVFMRVAARYPNCEDAPHFMALYKTSWTRRFTDLANADTADRVNVGMRAVQATGGGREEAEEQDHDFVGATDNDGALAVLIRQAPAEVTQVINLFLSAPQEILDMALAGWSDTRDARFTTGGSRRLCRLLGLPDDLDLMGMVERHFRR